MEDSKEWRIRARKTLITSVPFERAKISLGNSLKFHYEKLKIFPGAYTFSVTSI